MNKLIDITSTIIALTAGLVVVYYTGDKTFSISELLIFLYVTHILFILLRRETKHETIL